MSLYRYKAVSPAGEIEEREVDAAMQSAVIMQLQDAGYVPIRVEPAQDTVWWKALRIPFRVSRGQPSTRDIEVFTRELATLLGAKLPLDYSLQTLMEVAENESLRRLTNAVYDRVRDGAAFSAALESEPGVFSGLYISMIRAGEMAGNLDATLARLAEYLQRIKDLRDSVLSALTYPLILICVAGISVIVLLTFVIPQFSQIFEDMGAALPLATQIVIGAGEYLRSYWWALPLALMAAIAGVRLWLADPVRHGRWDRRVLRLPLIGDLVTKVEVARFTRTLGIMLDNGVPLLGALNIVKGSIGNRALGEAVSTSSERLQGGQGLASPLAETGLFPKLATKMIRVGEESGQLEAMLTRVADVYDRETRQAVQRMLSLLEPVLIIGLGLVIAGIIISILVAVLGMNQLVF